jgi:hypothetical protein
MPGLLRGIARTAAVAGTATAVSNRVSRRQAGRWAAQEPQPRYQPPPAPEHQQTEDPMTQKLAQLKELGELKAAGVLTEAEFQAQKQRILG